MKRVLMTAVAAALMTMSLGSVPTSAATITQTLTGDIWIIAPDRGYLSIVINEETTAQMNAPQELLKGLHPNDRVKITLENGQVKKVQRLP